MDFWPAVFFCFVVLCEPADALTLYPHKKIFFGDYADSLMSPVFPLRRISCQPLRINHGRMRSRARSSFAQFQCNKGYRLAGERYAKCINGRWDIKPPKCVRATCQKIRPPSNGLIYPSHGGAVLNFFCKPGYDLKGPFAAFCDGARWDGYLPSCLKSNHTATLSCDFENEDLCGWSHDLNHNFDWTRLNYATPSGHIGTGPRFDHTKGKFGDGYYMYIESSSKNVNDTARLISPVYARQDNATCLEFYYHMYGTHIGDLRVYLKKVRDSWDLDPDTSVFWRSGNHGDHWLRSFTYLGAVDDEFQIVFEGVRGASYVSDIAIDDVKLIEGCTDADEGGSTTESEEVFTNAIGVESCTNRCNGETNVTSSNAFQVACDCDENCMERNTCCPDYAAICILGSFDFSTEYSFSEEAMVNATTPTTRFKPNSTTTTMVTTKLTTTAQGSSLTSNTTITYTTPTATTLKIVATTTPIPTKSIKPIPSKSTKPTTTATMTPIPTTSIKPTTTATTSKTPPTTRLQVKIVTQTTPSSTTKKIEKTTTKTNLYNDIVTIPNGLTPEETFPPLEMTTPGDDFVYVSTTTSPSAKPQVEKTSPKASNKSAIIAVASVCLAIFGVVCAVFAIKRYSYWCLRMKKMKNGNGDSQSDVRFLTSDEILDFTVARPDDY